MANRGIIPGTEAQRQDLDQYLKDYRERYRQTLPEGVEDWKHEVPRVFTSGAEVAAAIPGALPGAVKGAISGMMGGPREGAMTLEGALKGAAIGGIGGSLEEAAAPFVNRALLGGANVVTPPGVDPRMTAHPFLEYMTTRGLKTGYHMAEPEKLVEEAAEKTAEHLAPASIKQAGGMAGGGMYGRMRGATLRSLQR
jgi:hypothetical protein